MVGGEGLLAKPCIMSAWKSFLPPQPRRHSRTWAEGGGDALFLLLLWFQTPHQMEASRGKRCAFKMSVHIRLLEIVAIIPRVCFFFCSKLLNYLLGTGL